MLFSHIFQTSQKSSYSILFHWVFDENQRWVKIIQWNKRYCNPEILCTCEHRQVSADLAQTIISLMIKRWSLRARTQIPVAWAVPDFKMQAAELQLGLQQKIISEVKPIIAEIGNGLSKSDNRSYVIPWLKNFDSKLHLKLWLQRTKIIFTPDRP